MNLLLRPYQPSDAAVITSWLKSEYLMRQWCADRYEHFPVTPEDMNRHYARYIDGQRSHALTMVDGNDIAGYITLRVPADNPTEQRLGFVVILSLRIDKQRGAPAAAHPSSSSRIMAWAWVRYSWAVTVLSAWK